MRNVTINISSDNNNSLGNVLIEGDLTLVNAAEIKSKLHQVLNDFKMLSVKIDNVTSIDLSVIQLFYAFQKSALTEHKSITFQTTLPDNLQCIIEQGGFEMFFNSKN